MTLQELKSKVRDVMISDSLNRLHNRGCLYNRDDYCSCPVFEWTNSLDKIVEATYKVIVEDR